MNVEELKRLRLHRDVLRAHKQGLDEHAQRNHRQILQEQFGIIAGDIATCVQECPDLLLSPFEPATFRSAPIQGHYLFNVEALRSYLAGSLARIEAQLSESPIDARAATNRGFLSHVATDHALAVYLKELLEAGAPGANYFLASQRGHIPSGDPWCEVILREVKRADRFLVLLTPASVDRLWVSFETGAAWMSGHPRVLLAAGGLRLDDIPTPLSELQVLSLDGSQGANALVQALEQLGSQPPADIEAALERTQLLARAALQSAALERGWKYVALPDGATFLAWDGPLDHLEDRPAVKDRLEFGTALDEAGCKVLWRDPHLVAQPLRQVYLTDLMTWKREVGNAACVLAVAPPDASPSVASEHGPPPSAWSGVEVGHRFYAWDGPLDDLEDREPVQMALALDDTLKKSLAEVGVAPAWRNRSKLDSLSDRQLFVTDRRTYRRAIVSGDVVLVVRVGN